MTDRRYEARRLKKELAYHTGCIETLAWFVTEIDSEDNRIEQRLDEHTDRQNKILERLKRLPKDDCND